MRKLFGAASILLGCFWAALGRLRRKKEDILLLRTLAQSLLELRRTLSERQQSLGGIFFALAQKHGKEPVGAFYEDLGSKIGDLGERSFSEIWREAVEDRFASTEPEVCDALRPLGDFLGGSELERQCRALDSAAQRIAELAEAGKEALRGEMRLNLSLSLCAGAFLVIMLM